MNKQRRAELGRAADMFAALSAKLNEALAAASAIKEIIEQTRDDEQEALDNLPDSLQEGERGTSMSESIGYLEEVADTLDALIEALEFPIDDTLQQIDDARGQA